MTLTPFLIYYYFFFLFLKFNYFFLVSLGSSRSATPAFSPTNQVSSPSPRQNVFMPITSPASQSSSGMITRSNSLVSPNHTKWKTQTSPLPSQHFVGSTCQNVIR